VFPSLAWSSFKPRKALQKKVKEAIENDTDLQAEVRALKRSKPKLKPKARRPKEDSAPLSAQEEQ
jgi:FtsZ-binding cell division protein ZapB